MTILIPYLRKSSKEDPAISRERQSRAIEAWAKQHDVELGPEVWEPGVSGSKHWRERGLGEAIAACERGEAAGIIVEEQSRLSRGNQLQTAEVWTAFEQGGFRLVCTAEGLDTANGDQELPFGLRALIARDQWKQYARRMEDSKRNAIARGLPISGTVPFGYRRVDQRYVIDPTRGPIVTELFARRAGGESYGALTRWLRELVPGGISGKGWSRQAVARILANPTYLGEVRQGEHVNPKAHEALVELDVFDAVQIRGRRAEPAGGAKSEPALLAGLVRCAECGYAMSRSWSGGRWVYRHRVGSDCPSPSSIVMGNLDRYVAAAAFGFVETMLEAEAIDPNAERTAIVARRDVLEAELAAYDRELIRALGPRALESINEINAEIAELDEQLALLRGDRPVFPERITWDDLSIEERHDALAALVASVLVAKAPRGTDIVDRVEIRWFDEDPGFARPTLGRTEVVAGVAAA